MPSQLCQRTARWLLITTITFVFALATSLFSGSCEMSIAFRGNVAVVAPVVTSSSMREMPELVSPTGDWSTMSKLPNRSVTGNVSSAWIS